jgi:GNAT superfamily N-acetyltransferase
MASENFVISLAEPEDISSLPDIERSADQMFKPYSDELGLREELFDHVNSVETFTKAQLAGQLWIAKTILGEVIGFALLLEIESFAHIEELAVLPSYGRQGVGSALLMAVCTWAKAAGFNAVTLRTFKLIPWNEPFYKRRGFQVVESSSLSVGHEQLEIFEQQQGLRTETRITMSYNMVD